MPVLQSLACFVYCDVSSSTRFPTQDMILLFFMPN